MITRLIPIILGLILGVRWGFAQVTTGSISGTLRDSSGAVIPGVSITAKNVDTGTLRSLMTDTGGHYQAPNLPVGNYEVQAQKDGFQTEVRRGIALTVGREAVVHFELQVGAVTQTLEVTAEAPLVETTGSSVGGLVETQQIINLPLNGRSFDELALLQPTVTVAKYSSASIQSGYTTKISIRGARTEQNSFLLDGTDVMGPTNQIPGSVGGQSFGVDAVREFRVETSTYSAQYGRAAGGVINVITKSGTNQLHGTVFEFLRNDNLDAARWEDNRNGLPKPEFKRNQFGFSLGGPVMRDRTFFFGSYEGLRDREGRTRTSNVPTAQIRAGAIAAVRPYLDVLYPLPNGRISSDGTGEYSFSVGNPTNEDFFTVRGDHSFSPNDSVFLRYTYDKGQRTTSTGVGTIFAERDNSRNHFITLEQTHLFSPSLLNSARLGFNRSYTSLTPIVEDIPESTLASLAFVPGQPFLLNGSSLAVDGLTGVGNDNLPRIWSWNLFEVSDDVVYNRGVHSLKMGGLFKTMLYIQRAAQARGGVYEFTSVDNFLAGRPSAFRALQPQAVSAVGFPYKYLGWFVQDDIRLNSRLTLNLGLRHEFYTGPTERHDRFCTLDRPSDTQLRCGGEVFPTSISTKNFAPRVGFAWDVFGDGRTSARGGWGVFFDSMSPLWWQGPAAGSFPPFSDAQVANPSILFPNSYQLVGSPASQVSYLATSSITDVPSSMQYNFTLQRQITGDSTLMVGYVGSVGRHLWTRANENTRQPLLLADGGKQYPASGPRRNPLFADVRRVRTEANSNYNGLLTSFQKRFGDGLQFQVSYTLSKSIDTGSSITNQSAGPGGGGTALLDADDWRLDRSLSDFDTRHALSLNSVWQVPVGPGKRWGSGLAGVSARLAEGWQFSGVFRSASGSPATINNAARNWSQNGLTNRIERPDLAPGASNNPVEGVSQSCSYAGAPAAGTKLGTPDLYYDPCAFRLQTLGFHGNLGRNTITGPDHVTLDLSVLKNTAVPAISEQFQLQFRAEFFNVLNHANFGLPGLRPFTNNLIGQIQSATAGVITTTATRARQIQFGLKILF